MLWARLRLTAVAVGLLLACAQPANASVSRKQATRTAMKVLHARSGTGPVALFATKSPIAASAKITVLLADGHTVRGLNTPHRRAWLFWFDQQYHALFGHLSAVLLVDAKSGKAIGIARMMWYPFVNGRMLPWLTSKSAYNGRRYRVFVREPRAPRGGLTRRVRAQPKGYAKGPYKVNAATFQHDCMLVIGDHQDPRFAPSYEAMKGWAKAVGLDVIDVRPSVAALDTAVEDAIDRAPNPCTDVFIYLAGHGTPPPGKIKIGPQTINQAGGPASVTIHTTNGVPDEQVHPEDLQAIFDKYAGRANFKLKIMSCFSGRFLDLASTAKNLEIVEVSSAATEASLFHFDRLEGRDKKGNKVTITNNVDNPDGADEFTNQDVHGLYEWAATDGSGGLAKGLERSLDLGENYNAARILKLATPPPARTNAPEQPSSPFTVPFTSGYDHTVVGGPGRPSTVCADFRTVPAQPGATWEATITPGGRTASGTLDGSGEGRVVFGIPAPGSYQIQIKVTSGSQTQTVTATVDVPDPDSTHMKSKDCSAPPAPS